LNYFDINEKLHQAWERYEEDDKTTNYLLGLPVTSPVGTQQRGQEMTTWKMTSETKSTKILLNIAKFIKDAYVLRDNSWLVNCFLLY